MATMTNPIGLLGSRFRQAIEASQKRTAQEAGFNDWDTYSRNKRQQRIGGEDLVADARAHGDRTMARMRQLEGTVYDPRTVDAQGQGLTAQQPVNMGRRIARQYGRGTGAGYAGIADAARMMREYATGKQSIAQQQGILQQQQMNRNLLSQMYSSGASSPAALLNAQNAASQGNAQIAGQTQVAALQEKQAALQNYMQARAAQGQLGQAQAGLASQAQMRGLDMGLRQQATAAQFEQMQEQARMARSMGLHNFANQMDLNSMQLLYGAQSAEAQAKNQKTGGILGAVGKGIGSLFSFFG